MMKNEEQIILNGRKRLLPLKGKRAGPFTRDDLLQCRISVVPLWQRLIVVGAGLGCGGIGVSMWLSAVALWSVCLLFGLGLVLILLGVFGKRQRIEVILRGLDSAGSLQIIDAIFDGL